jgi:hypothetical protein
MNVLLRHTSSKQRLRRTGQLLLAFAALAALNACASSADSGAMTVTAQSSSRPFPQALQHAMCVRNVTGGEETNPLWASKVDDNGFRTALSGTLDAAGLSAASSSSCAYPVDANLLGLSQPVLGIDMTVTSHVNYKVYAASGQPFVLATIDAPYTAKMSDSLIGVKRLKIANEGSIRASIEQFLDKLRDTTPK